MNLTPQKLRKIITQGESETVEFRKELPPDESVSIILTAFANTKGGILILGVEDSGEIIGLTEGEVHSTIARLNSIAFSLFSWPFEVAAVELGGKKVVYISVSQAPDHLMPITTSAGRVYKKQGTQFVALSAALMSISKETAPVIINGKRVKIPAGSTIKSIPDKTKGGPSEPKRNPSFTAFVAMSFRQEEEPALVDYYCAMERSIEKTKFGIKLTRIDLVEGDYEISHQLMERIDNADIVIADFTLKPSNVYFELGYARGRRKRVIQTARKDTLLEFDVRNWRTIFYRNATELEAKLILALDAACEEISNSKDSSK